MDALRTPCCGAGCQPGKHRIQVRVTGSQRLFRQYSGRKRHQFFNSAPLPARRDLVFVALVAVLAQSRSVSPAFKALGESTKTLIGAGFVLVFTIPMVRIFINSGVNGAELSSMPVTTANFAAGLVGEAFPMLSAAVGALGAFIAGSNTVSNMMFSQFQFEVAQTLTISSVVIVALQAVGQPQEI